MSNFDKSDLLRQDMALIPSYLEELIEIGVDDDVISVVVEEFCEEEGHLVCLHGAELGERLFVF